MSKPVRIRGDVAARVELVASVERRSFANMVEVLLLQALERAEVPSARAGARLEVVAREAVAEFASGAVPPVVHDVVVRPHMKKNRPAVECPTRILEGVCPDCGQEVGGG